MSHSTAINKALELIPPLTSFTTILRLIRPVFHIQTLLHEHAILSLYIMAKVLITFMTHVCMKQFTITHNSHNAWLIDQTVMRVIDHQCSKTCLPLFTT